MELSQKSKIILLAASLFMLVSTIIYVLGTFWYDDLRIKVSIIMLIYTLPMILAFRHFNKKISFSSEEKGAILLILLALPIFSYALVGVQTPLVSYSKNVAVNIVDSQTGAILDTYQMATTFTARGSFSAENPIHVKVTAWNCTVPNYLNRYTGVGFTGGFLPNATLENGYIPVASHLCFSQKSPTEYVAEGDLIWHAETKVYFEIVEPKGFYIKDDDEIQNSSDVAIDITSISDTLTNRSSETMEKLTYAVIGFSIIMLQPVISVLYPNRVEKKETTVYSSEEEP